MAKDIGETSPEQVAYALFTLVLSAETPKPPELNRKWILDTYAECLQTVRSPAERRNQTSGFRAVRSE